MKYNSTFKKSSQLFERDGFVIKNINNQKVLEKINYIIEKYNQTDLLNEKQCDFNNIKIQDEIYNKNYHLEIIKKEFLFLKSLFKIKSLKELKITSFVHLRAVKKKNKKEKNNFLGFHRETFYSDYDYTQYQVNISVPLLNYNKRNSMKVIKGTHLIPDSKIKTVKFTSTKSGIRKGSAKHKLGLPYNPKIIKAGINLKKAERTNLKNGQMIVFSGQLIHGNGKNNQKKTRFSIDFGLIKKKYLFKKKIKDHHISYSKNKKYWIDIK